MAETGVIPAEAVAQRCSVKKVFLEKGSDLQLYLKNDSGTGVFLRILRNF